MNCPYCKSTEVVEVAGKMWCQDCERSFDPSTASTPSAADPVPAADPATAPTATVPLLIKCPACSREVSSQAMRCPACGQPLASAVIATAAVTILKRIVYGIAILIALYIIIRGFMGIALEN